MSRLVVAGPEGSMALPGGGGGGGGSSTDPSTGLYPLAGYGLVGASVPIETATVKSSFSNQSLFLMRCRIPAGAAIAKVGAAVQAVGVFTAGNSGVAIYDDTGNLVQQSAVDTVGALWGATGWRFGTLTAPIPAGVERFVYAAILCGGYDAGEQILYNQQQDATIVNTGNGAVPRRAIFVGGGAATNLPASFNPATVGANTNFLPLVGIG